MEGQKLGDLTATAQTAGTDLNFQVNSDFAGSTIRVNGKSLLTGDHPTTATASITGLPIERALMVARRRDIPASGLLSANANLNGTFATPQVKATFSVTKGVVQQQPIDRLQASVNYTNQLSRCLRSRSPRVGTASTSAARSSIRRAISRTARCV